MLNGLNASNTIDLGVTVNIVSAENANPMEEVQVPVTESGITFVEAVKSGKARLIDIDDWVDAWHTKEHLTSKHLRDYLGFSQELYGSWMRNGPDALMCLMG